MKYFKKLTDFFKNRKAAAAVIIGLFGLLMIGVSSFKPSNSETKEMNDGEYKISVEKEIEGLISSVEGVGKAKVSVYLESSARYVYKETEETDGFGNTEKSIAMSEGKALLEKTLNPKIGGVLVICEGGDRTAVAAQITKIISGVYGVGANHIAVCKLSK